MQKILFIVLTIVTLSQAAIRDKDANDVYAISKTLKNKIMHIAGEKKIDVKYLKLESQTNKSPRHVFQKALEVLHKINKYRINNHLGPVNIPIYTSKNITYEDVYDAVKRLNDEVDLLLKKVNCTHINEISKTKNCKNKTSNDNYHEIWLASLAMDELLGRGYSPTYNYMESVLILDTINFLRNSQGIYDDIKKPQKKERQHPNHVLYATNKLLSKISQAEKRLWMEPVEVPKNPQRVITPTEVHDSMQTILTELVRIRRRLGIERFYPHKEPDSLKTPSDVLQNIEYATILFPKFDLSKELIQYDKDSLKKNINDIYALSEFILNKVEYLKEVKGIKVSSREPPMIYSLNTMHIYQKGIETMEKINKLRIKDKLYEVDVPSSPQKKKSTDSVYALLLMIDDEVSIIMKKNGIKDVEQWSYTLNKKISNSKTPSDVYHNLWKISSIIDIFRGTHYTPNETYILAKKLEQRIENISKNLIGEIKIMEIEKSFDKGPSDVFQLTLKLYDVLSTVEKRANISVGTIEIPKEKNITPDTVYNALRVVNATLIDLNINFGIEFNTKDVKILEKKTPSDIYDSVNKSYKILNTLLIDKNYEN
jgi:hypothetical protein